MAIIVSGLLIIWAVTLLGWFVEYIHQKLLIRAIRQSIKKKIEWLENKGDNEDKINTWTEALELITREVKK